MNTDGGEGLRDISPKNELTKDRMDSILADVDNASTIASLETVWHEKLKEIHAHGSRFQYEVFKAAVNKKKTEIESMTVEADQGGENA